MKKYLSLFAFAMVAVFSLSLISCGDDDEDEFDSKTSKLVGTWEIIKSEGYDNGKLIDIEDGYGAYWVFTSGTITIHDKNDLLNDQTINYTLKDNKLYLDKNVYLTILEHTSNKLVLKTLEINNSNLNSYDIITFQRRE